MTFPKYSYDRLGKQKDPMNIIFKNTTIEKIKQRFDRLNWRFRGKYRDFTSDQFTPDSLPRTIQDAQKIKGSFWKRYHVRIWKISETHHIAAGHYERFSLAFTHVPYNFEAAKDKIEETFSGSDNWNVVHDIYHLENRDNETYHNGTATEIEDIS
jgi:hypothetical protein